MTEIDTTQTRPATVLEQVLRTHDTYCHCTGGCGKRHSGATGTCLAGTDCAVLVELLAAPWPVVPATDHEATAVPVTDLRPWCVPCWRKARKRTIEQEAELRRIALESAQLGFDFDI